MTWNVVILVAVMLPVVGCLFCLAKIRRLRQERSELWGFSQRLLEAQEKERKRLAAELHGNLGQNLLIIKNRAELGLASGGTSSAMAEQLKAISEVCSVALDETRRTAHNLGPHHLDQLGLTEALDAMIDRVAASTGIHFERKLERVDDLFGRESSTSLYRIAQEALNNLMKHAHASSAQVHLIRDVRHVQLLVEDNGCGFEDSNGHQRNGGLGLAAIGERVRILKGKLAIESKSGHGTRLTVTIPFCGENFSPTE